MKITNLTIEPHRSWEPVSDKNPMRAVVKVNDDKSSVETVLSPETTARLVDVVAKEVAANAAQNMQSFIAATSTIELTAIENETQAKE